MTTLECAETQEHAPEFALGILHGGARAEIISHLERCQACATTVADFAEIVDGLMLVAPEAEPPVGFEDHALRAMLEQRRPKRRKRTLFAVATLIIVTIALTVASVRVIDGFLAPLDPPRAGNLVAKGAVVGKAVLVSGNHPWVMVSVEGGLPDGRYRAELLDPKGDSPLVGEFDVLGGRGAWNVPEAKGVATAVQVRILDSNGAEVARAVLPLG